MDQGEMVSLGFDLFPFPIIRFEIFSKFEQNQNRYG